MSTVELTGRELAHRARAAVARGISYKFSGGKSCIARARRARAGLTFYPPWIQIADVAPSLARRDHRKSEFGLHQVIKLIELYALTKYLIQLYTAVLVDK